MDRKAFSLLEILITVAVIAALAIGVLILINPLSIINRGNDITRKKNLDEAKKALEEYMADTGCYPQPTQVCAEGDNDGDCTLCTKRQSSKFSYFTKDICDPKSPSAEYMYQPETVLVPGSGYIVPTCPLWFRIYSVLDSAYNAEEDVWGCKKGGCGVSPLYGYSYLVASPGAPTEGMSSTNWYCLTDLNRCDQCTQPYSNCITPGRACYGKELYSSISNCCAANPGARYCD